MTFGMYKPLFKTGKLLMTPGVESAIPLDKIIGALGRHVTGDWGEVGEEDARENDLSVKEGFRILSAYTINGIKIWIITEADRSATTVLLPDEY